MSLKDLIADQASRVFLNTGHFAQSVTYNPPEGESVSVDGVFDEDDANGEVQHGTDREFILRRAKLEIARSFAVNVAGTFTANGATWHILGIGGADPDLQTIELQAPEQRRPGWQKRK